jgi:hypothetical protein
LSAGRKVVSLLARSKIAFSQRFRRFAGRGVLTESSANREIAANLIAGQPYMVSRLGSSELAIWVASHGIAAQRRKDPVHRLQSAFLGEPSSWPTEVVRTFANNAGFFPPKPAFLERYARELGGWLSMADLMAVWFYRHEDRMLRRYASKSLLALPMGLEPYFHDHPWTLALAGRRVLVVHPFAKSIRRQFTRRDMLFGDKRVLPEFELLTLPAVQSIGGQQTEFRNWFDALECMQEQIAKTSFDVAIIGAGAYGLPLAAFVKRQGRQAIHLGGSTQILFGIKGRRWADRPEVTRFYNELWAHPLPEETPAAYRSIEQGCYW